MNGWQKIALVVALAISSFFALTVVAGRYIEQRRVSEEITRLRDELYRARVSSDRCRGSLLTSESSLQTLTMTIDSLRIRVDSFEALGGGNVPANRYEEYLSVFESYNDSVAAWDVRSERLLAAEAACRAVIQEHNELSDSIQAILAGLGPGS